MITKSMLDNLDYDQQNKEMSSKVPTNQLKSVSLTATPTAMFIFASTDLNSAAYHLVQSTQNPFAANAIRSLFVQESILEQFLDVLKPQLPKYGSEIAQNESYKEALQSIARLNAKIISGTSPGAVIVFDVTHEHLGHASSNGSGVITLHTFRTAKEAVALFGKESLVFENASIWNENHSCAYELVAALKCTNFFLNCNQVSLEHLQPHIKNNGNYVTIDKSYHFETFSVDSLQKNVVFPIGTIFAN